MASITGSVGRMGNNRVADVLTVQKLLNQWRLPGQALPLRVDGIAGRRTVARIEQFQRIVLRMMRPDGRVDPQGKTIAALARGRAGGPKPSPAIGAQQMSAQGSNFLKGIEQLRLQPYDDQTGQTIAAWVRGATIGYGHLIRQSEWSKYKNGITQAHADILFATDLAPFAKVVKTKVRLALAQNQFDALVILAYNIGTNAFASSSVLKLVNNPAAQTPYRDLEAAWKAWNKSQGVVSRGLINRRAAEWNIYANNVYQRW